MYRNEPSHGRGRHEPSGPIEPRALAAVGAFHRLFGVPVQANPCVPDEKRCELRVSLLQEELNELSEAIKQNDLVEIADALADLQYVLSGTVHEFGMGSRFAMLFDEVHRSNMSKACATREEAEATVEHYAAKDQPAHILEQPDGSFLVKRIADDKVLKSVNYSPPSLGPIILEGVAARNAEAVGETSPSRRLNQGIF